jgi:hypothetical protein
VLLMSHPSLKLAGVKPWVYHRRVKKCSAEATTLQLEYQWESHCKT